MKYLASLPKEKKCDCGWYERGSCFGSCYEVKSKGGAPKSKYYCPKHKVYTKELMGRRCQIFSNEKPIGWCNTEVIIEKVWKDA